MNPKKPPGQRMRNGHIGVSFPPDRLDEVKSVAEANGLSVSAWVRLAIFQRLDAIKKNKVAV